MKVYLYIRSKLVPSIFLLSYLLSSDLNNILLHLSNFDLFSPGHKVFRQKRSSKLKRKMWQRRRFISCTALQHLRSLTIVLTFSLPRFYYSAFRIVLRFTNRRCGHDKDRTHHTCEMIAALKQQAAQNFC